MRIPLLSGTRLLVVNAPDDAVVLAPPEPPADSITDVGAAVRDALRFPLSGPPVEGLAGRGARATVLVDVPSLPIPSSPVDPRRAAVGGAVQELRRLGVPDERQTILVAAGLGRRPGRRDLDRLFAPAFARAFHGRVVVHDVESERLAALGEADGIPLEAARQLVESDLVIVVSAAETVLHGGPAALVAAGGRAALRAADAASLLETRGSTGWQLGLAFERELSRRVPVVGLSLALHHPRIGDAALGYPYDPASLERLTSAWLTKVARIVPGALRARVLASLPLSVGAAAAFAGPPSVAHAEAMLRAVESRSAELDRPLDAVCIGIPHTSPHLPRERPNPLLAAYIGLGLALRLWRDRPPVVEGGTAVLVHRFHRHFTHPTQQPYRAFFAACARGPDPELIAQAEAAATTDARALERYRAGRSCHPLLPFADWAAVRQQAERLGAIIVGGCRDGTAARQLGFVPSHGIGPALEMALGRSGGSARVGFLLTPPYFPLRVG